MRSSGREHGSDDEYLRVGVGFRVRRLWSKEGVGGMGMHREEGGAPGHGDERARKLREELKSEGEGG